jgi:septal ring factor EnvC (AmiA/AmiB activator)
MTVLDGAIAMDRKKLSGASPMDVMGILEKQMNDAIEEACAQREQKVRAEMSAEHARMTAEIENLRRKLDVERSARITAESAKAAAEQRIQSEKDRRREADNATHNKKTLIGAPQEPQKPVAYKVDISRGSNGLMQSFTMKPME